MTDDRFVQDPPAERLDRPRVQAAVRHIRNTAARNPVSRDDAYEILNAWDDGDELTPAEVKAVLARFDV